jgi:formylglycine-generating enzyme required for sulfatase activity
MRQPGPPIDVFISYKRENGAAAKALAEALASRGYSVWWDIDLLPGDRFADEIMAVISRAKAAVVLWSKHAVASDFVRAEADTAREAGKLIPARLDNCALPLPFNVLHTIDLGAWQGDADDALLQPLLKALAARVGQPRTVVDEPAEATANLHQGEDEVLLWRSISERQPPSADEYDVYLRTYPNGVFADLARARRAAVLPSKNPWFGKKAALTVVAAAAVLVVLAGALSRWDDFDLGPAHREAAAPLAPPANPVATASATGATPGETFRDCDECPSMIVIPAGRFMMGSPDDEDERDGDEGPRHLVTIAEPLALGVHEVTFAEWDACLAAGGCRAHRPDDQGWGRGQRPVIDVSWHDTQAYVAWLSAKTGQLYRLPSEAEWEYAARAGTGTPFHFGATLSTDLANYDGRIGYAAGPTGVFRGRTLPVGSFAANAFGLYDVHGNVSEWLEDCWNGSYAGGPDDGSAWTSGDCSRRLLRGGSWHLGPRFLRSAIRYGYLADERHSFLGFRVARELH